MNRTGIDRFPGMVICLKRGTAGCCKYWGIKLLSLPGLLERRIPLIVKGALSLWRSLEKNHCSSTLTGASWSPLDASLGRWSGCVPPRGDPREDPGHAGVTMPLGWPRNSSESFWKSWRKFLSLCPRLLPFTEHGM